MGTAAAFGLGLASVLLSGCSRPPHPPPSWPRPGPGEYSLMTFNLGCYGLADRDGDGQKDDPKPEAERRAVIELLRQTRPDILAIQEIGSRAAFRDLGRILAQSGLEYPHQHHWYNRYSMM